MRQPLIGSRFLGWVVLVSAGFLAACQPETESASVGGPPPPTVTVAKPVVRELVDQDEYVGRFAAVDDVTVRSRVSGYLDQIRFRDGQMVKAGDPLFTIDQRPLNAALDEANASVATAQAQLEFAQTQFNRGQDLVGRGTIPQVTFDEREQALLSAQALFDAANAAKVRAELNLEFSAISAPIPGRIDRNFVSIGNLVNADQTALTSIVSLDPIEFYFDIDERALINYARDARVRGDSLQEGSGGTPVSVRLAAGNDGPFEGALNFAENRVDEASGTIRLRASFANPDFIMQPGMFGRITVPGSLPYRGVLVPDEAVSSDQNRRIVYVLNDDDTVAQRDVRPGPRLFGYRVIRTGLTGEETVVINGLVRIRSGMTVTPELVELPPEAPQSEG